MKTDKKTTRRRTLFAVLAAGLLCTVLGVLSLVSPVLERGRRPPSFGVLPGDILLQVPADALPPDTLYISADRQAYDGTMRLVVPNLSVDTAVGSSTMPELLKTQPGLYEFSQLPHEQGGNVSIAGHRDIHDMVFYNLDKLKAGDLLYLLYDGAVYQYLYEDTAIVEPTDWSVILPKGYDRLTLTTCDPIGTTRNRLIVTGALVTAYPLEGNPQFSPHIAAPSEQG